MLVFWGGGLSEGGGRGGALLGCSEELRMSLRSLPNTTAPPPPPPPPPPSFFLGFLLSLLLLGAAPFTSGCSALGGGSVRCGGVTGGEGGGAITPAVGAGGGGATLRGMMVIERFLLPGDGFVVAMSVEAGRVVLGGVLLNWSSSPPPPPRPSVAVEYIGFFSMGTVTPTPSPRAPGSGGAAVLVAWGPEAATTPGAVGEGGGMWAASVR